MPFVTSRLDYCNGLMYGLPDCLINRLERVQNTTARLVTKSGKYDHITPVLKNLHWLPVKYRLEFKILLQVFKSLHGHAPSYLRNKLTLRQNNKTRSDNKLLLSVPRSRLKTYGDRAFSICGPKLWNSLPDEVRLSETVGVFKTRLKTHLFRKAFAIPPQ